MKRLIILLIVILWSVLCNAQGESHNFLPAYDTTLSFPQVGNPFGAPDVWVLRISRPIDTLSRPAIITMNGQGELGSVSAATAGLLSYGPFYWLANGWDGSVQLANGNHFPILITCGYTNNLYPTAPSYYTLLSYLIKNYHIKTNSLYLGGLSQGTFTAGALIEYEQTAGAETGMKIIKAMALFEGTPDPLPAPYSTWSRGDAAFGVWAQKYGGRFFTLEGSGLDNDRNSYIQANAMNAVVPGSAYFSYENINGGNHSGWATMYSPFNTNWTCVGTLGPNNSPSQVGVNTMGTYRAPSSVFQWMLRQGDTTLVGGSQVVVIPPNCPPIQSCPLPIYAVGFSYSDMSNKIIDTVFYNNGQKGPLGSPAQ
jgi:hypothetical protein